MNYHRFEALLERNGTTVYKVAKATGISNSTFTDWKNGRSKPKTDKIKLIADYFGVSLDALLDVEGGNTEAVNARSAVVRKLVPIIGEIRAGAPIITNETLLGHELADGSFFCIIFN